MGKFGIRRTDMPDARLKAPHLEVGHMEFRARQHDMRQIAAISAFEGMHPTPDYERIRTRYTSGEISVQEFKRLVAERWKRNG